MAQQLEVAKPNSPEHVQAGTKLAVEGYDENISSDSRPITIQSLGEEIADDATYVLTSPLRIDATDALVLGGVAAGIGGLMAADGDIRDFFQKNRGETKNDVANGLEVAGRLRPQGREPRPPRSQGPGLRPG